MVQKNTVGMLIIGMIIGAALFALVQEPLYQLLGTGREGDKEDITGILESLETKLNELDDNITLLNDTLTKSDQDAKLVYLNLRKGFEKQQEVMVTISDLPLIEMKAEPTREELACYKTLLASQDDLPLLDSAIREWEEQLSTLGDDAQLASIDLQNALQKQQQIIQMLSNLSKILHDTATSVIQKIG